MQHDDKRRYYRFTGPKRLDKAIHSLEGIVRGIAIDGTVNSSETRSLAAWLHDIRPFVNFHPFNEFATTVERILEDGVIDDEEKADLLWLVSRLGRHNTDYDHITSDMQRLHGILGGIVADGVISHDELAGLQRWIDDRTHLKTLWPYDEVESLLLSVLRDHRIDATEHDALLAFFSEFTDRPGHRAIERRDDEIPFQIRGVCTACPEIEFYGRTFCFTGQSVRMTRSQLAAQVVQLGGNFSANVTQTIDYLVVGADGNPCWAYACYGRKVEKAIELRRKGIPLLIVHEHDFWDTAQDRLAGVQ